MKKRKPITKYSEAGPEEKKCPRCSRIFLCNRHNIAGCGCSAVMVPDSIRIQIKKDYNDCLCVECLRELAGAAVENDAAG